MLMVWAFRANDLGFLSVLLVWASFLCSWFGLPFCANGLGLLGSTCGHARSLADLQVVSQASARSSYGRFKVVDCDHIAICKPQSEADPVYVATLQTILPALGLE